MLNCSVFIACIMYCMYAVHICSYINTCTQCLGKSKIRSTLQTLQLLHQVTFSLVQNKPMVTGASTDHSTMLVFSLLLLLQPSQGINTDGCQALGYPRSKCIVNETIVINTKPRTIHGRCTKLRRCGQGGYTESMM